MKALIVNRDPLGRLVRIMAWFQRAFTDREVILLLITCLCIALFGYSGAIKLAEYSVFVVRIGQSPMLAPFAGFIGWFIPVFELVISVALIVSIFVSRIQLPALYLFFVTMVLFCFYIVAIFTVSPNVPCACGGVIGEIGGWWGHLLFNLVFVALSYKGMQLAKVNKPFPPEARKRFFQLGVAIPFTIVVILGLMVDPLPNHRFRGFDRTFIEKEMLSPESEISLGTTGYYIAGIVGQRIYLAHHGRINHILVVDAITSDTSHIKIEIPPIAYHWLTLNVLGETFYLMDGTGRKVYRGNVGDWHANLYLDGTWFASALPLNDGQMVLFSMREQQNVLAKKHRDETGSRLFPGLLIPQGGEGRFSTDGKILYNPENEHIIFLYNYRNEYLVMDTAINLIHQGHTIDTISQVQLKIGKVGDEERYVLQDFLLVNAGAAVSGEYLYVRSRILAANENARLFNRRSVLDVYHYTTGRYVSSFYLPGGQKENLREFRILNNEMVVALQGKKLYTYKLTAYGNHPTGETGHLMDTKDIIAQLNRKKGAEHLSKKK